MVILEIDNVSGKFIGNLDKYVVEKIKVNNRKSPFYTFCIVVQVRGGIRLIKGRIKTLFRAQP